MDVGNPSNMERLRALHPDFEELQGQIGASSVDDIEIRATIRRDSHELRGVVPAHGDGREGVPPAAGARRAAAIG